MVSKRKALLIGVAGYQDPQVSSFPQDVIFRDLDTLQASLESSFYDVTVLGKGGPLETTRNTIDGELREACQKAKKGEMLLLYLSGHGLHHKGQDYFVPTDVRMKDPERLAEYLVSLDLSDAFEQCKAQTIVVVIDACREGIKLTEKKSLSLAGWTRGDRRQAGQKNTVYIFGCSQGQYAHYISGDDGFSLFTRAFASVIDSKHPACTIEDVLRETQDTLNSLSQEYEKPIQEIRYFQELGAKQSEQQRIICEGVVPTQLETVEEVSSFRGIPMIPRQMPPIPTQFVPRPEHSNELKRRLLSDNISDTLVVSAIYGLGGIGKSVLATVLAHDDEIQDHFSDGILWITLGQNPDIQKGLGNWIQALRDFDYKPTTIEAASSHLRTLLYGKRVLLIVDDVWQSDHLDPFRIGGKKCRVLVTTREAAISDADRYDLDVMTDKQSIQLLEKAMNRDLLADEVEETSQFAKAVGYLPLALELAAVQINDGFTWRELFEEFQKNVVDLSWLDSPESSQILSPEQLRKHSLEACFYLSLRRLPPEILEKFAWLGILPEDVEIKPQMAATLWNVSVLKAKKVLQLLKSRALLIPGATSQLTQQAYRLHDLMHDTARGLICESSNTELPGLGLSLPDAHKQVLSQYHNRTEDGLWHTLQDDGYIHTYLTWHMEEAGCLDDIHALFKETNSAGRNGWYEICDRLGQPAIFVTDLSRAWRLAEDLYLENRVQSLALQVHYALIFASLESLIRNIPVELMAALVRSKNWSPAQGLAYAQQTMEPRKRAAILRALAKYWSPILLEQALKVVRELPSEFSRSSTLSVLFPYLPVELFSEVLRVIRDFPSEPFRSEVLIDVAPHLPASLFSESLEVLRTIKFESYRASALNGLLPYVPAGLCSKVLAVIREFPSELSRVSVLCGLMPYLSEDLFSEALAFVCTIRSESYRVFALIELIPHLPAELFSEVLSVVRDFPSESYRADVLIELVLLLPAELLPEALSVARAIESDLYRASALRVLVPHLPEILLEALDAARAIHDQSARASALCKLVLQLPEIVSEVFELVRTIEPESSRAAVLLELASHLPNGLLLEALSVTRAIESESSRVLVLRGLVPYLPESLLHEVLEVTRGLPSESSRTSILRELASRLSEDLFSQALVIVRALKVESLRAHALIEFSPYLSVDLFSGVLGGIRGFQSQSFRADLLIAFFPYLSGDLFSEVLVLLGELQSDISIDSVSSDSRFSEALVAISEVHPESFFDDVLRKLVLYLPTKLLSKALSTACAIESESSRASALSILALHLPLSKSLEVLHTIKFESSRASALSELAPHLPAELLSEALSVARAIESNVYRASALRSLASHFPELLSEALSAARAIKFESSRASALSELAPHLPAELLSEALSVARAIESNVYRASALRSLSPHLPTELLSEALSTARAIRDDDDHASALSELSPYLPAELLSEALSAARAIKFESSRASALSELAPHLPAELLSEALSEVRALDDNDDRALALSRLASHFPELLSEALSAARALPHPVYHASALRELASHFPELLSEALSAACAVSEPRAHASALSELAPHLPAELLSEALSEVRALDYNDDRALALSRLASHFPELLPEALSAARAIHDNYDRASVLSELASNFPELLSEALSTVRAIHDDYERASVLSELAPHLPAELLSEALSVALVIPYDDEHAFALSRLASHFPELLSEALSVACVIPYDDERADVLMSGNPVAVVSEILHITASKGRKSVMEVISNLTPAFIELSDLSVLSGIVKSMKEVRQQWP